MSEKRPYSAIGGVFEYLNNDCGYEQWSQYLIEKLRVSGFHSGARGVDAGCGNGYFTRAMCAAGYDVLGLDVSPEALTRAVEIARGEGKKIEFVQGDISKLNLNFKPDFITAVNDCINYIPQEKVLKTFKKVYRSLKKGGAFIFDISAEKKLKNVLGNNLFAEDKGDVAYMWFNALKEDRVEMDITVFTRQKDGTYRRADEAQTQYIHRSNDILNALKEAGFAAETSALPFATEDERICFICRKP